MVFYYLFHHLIPSYPIPSGTTKRLRITAKRVIDQSGNTTPVSSEKEINVKPGNWSGGLGGEVGKVMMIMMVGRIVMMIMMLM